MRDSHNMQKTDVSIPCGTLTLEGVLEAPEKSQAILPGAVVCHPHPLYGGNMHNSVVRAVRNAFIDKGFACLRFNFRGTGGSWGEYGNGIDELDDVLAAMDFLGSRSEIDEKRLVIAGYSFGCWVGLKAAVRDSRPGRLIGISPPVNEYDFDFLNKETRPKLLITGDRDFVCSKEGFQKLLDQIPEPKRGVIIPGADHFHMNSEDIITEEIRSFLTEYPFEERKN
jgi:alpha/beta superfamily hydrolase